MKKYVGIDVGGTEIKFALLDEKAQFLEKGLIDTPHTNLEDFVEAIGSIVDRFKPDVEAVVMSVPGRVDSKNGFMFTGGAIRYNYNVAMTDLISKRVDLPVVLENDAKCAALAEHPFGTIKQKLGWSHFLMRGKTKVAGENALIMLTYNFRRMLNLIGIKLFQKLIKASKSGNIEDIKQEIAEYIAVLAFFEAFFRQKMSFYI